MLEKPYPGKCYGCIDTDAPSHSNPKQLSRVVDMLYAAQESGIVDAVDVFKLLPEHVRLEFNYSRWHYVV